MSNRFTELPKSKDDLRYPELERIMSLKEERAIEVNDRLLTDWSPEKMQKFVDDNTITLELGGRAHRLVRYVPHDFNQTAVVVPSGLASGAGIAPVIIGEITRQAVDDKAALLVLPNASFGTPVNNFSKEELHRLRDGDPSPMMDRLRNGLDELQEEFGAERAIISGASLGAAIGGKYLEDNNKMPFPAIAATLTEPVNVRNWTSLGLLAAFSRSQGDYKKVNKLMAPEGMTGERLIEIFKTKERFNREAIREILALAGVLKKNTLLDNLSQAPDNVPIVHMSSEKSRISPYAANMEVFDAMCVLPNYEYVGLQNPNSQHFITIAAPALGAVALYAMERHERLVA